MADIQTKLVVQAETKGFAQAEKAAESVSKKLDATAAGISTGFSEAAAKLSAMTAKADKVAKALGAGLGKSVAGLGKDLNQVDQRLGKVAESARKAESAIHKMGGQAGLTGAGGGAGTGGGGSVGGGGGGRPGGGGGSGSSSVFSEEEARKMRHGSFLHGFLQSTLPGPAMMLSRGPGMFRQGAGMMAGQIASGLASAPFLGMGALGAVAGTFGGIAGNLFSGTSDAGRRAISFQQSQSQLAPYLGGFGTRHVGTHALEKDQAGLGDADMQAAIGRAQAQVMRNSRQTLAKNEEEQAFGQMTEDLANNTFFGMRAVPRPRNAQQDAARNDAVLARSRAEAEAGVRADYEARREAHRQSMNVSGTGSLSGSAARLAGLDLGQAQQFMAALARSGGGSAASASRQGMVTTSLAAQGAYGIGPEVSGAFLQAGRVGGVSGPQRSGDSYLTDAIRDGLAMGLEGSELNDYMQEMAQDIRSWKMTGIPIAQDSIGKLGGALGALGLRGVQAATGAAGAVRTIQDIGREGPRDAFEYAVLQKIGGYRQGTGTRGFLDSRQTLEEMDSTQIEKLVPDILREIGGLGNDESQNALNINAAMKRFGIQTSVKTSRLISTNLRGAKRTPEQEEAMRRSLGDQTAGQAQAAVPMTALAEANIGTTTAQAAMNANQNVTTGESMVPALQKMDAAAENAKQSFSSLGDAISSVSGAMLNLSKLILSITPAGSPQLQLR